MNLKGFHSGEFLSMEIDRRFCRETRRTPANVVLSPGTVLGVKTADNTIHPWDGAANDGTETVDSILITPVTVSGPPVDVDVLTNHALVNESLLYWKAGVDQAAGKDALRAKYIKMAAAIRGGLNNA